MIPRAELAQLFADLTRYPTIWDGDPEPYGPRRCRLNVVSYTSIGSGEVRYYYDAETDTNTPIGNQVHTMTLSVYVEAQDDEPSWDVLERTRAGLRRGSALGQLSALGLALSRVVGSFTLDRVADNRVIWASNMDVILLHTTSDADAPYATYVRAPTGTLPGAPLVEETAYILTINTTNVIPGNVT